MFNPTHVLVTRTRQTPVCLVSSSKGVYLFTEQEWGTVETPAFEFHPKQGFFCKGIPVIGYSLQPINLEVTNDASSSQVNPVKA